MPDTHTTSSTLSDDIKLLGGLLGRVIQEQHGKEAFDLVEKVRLTAKSRRSQDLTLAQQLTTLIKGTSIEEKQVLTKAFSNYFQLINIAEDQQRIRVLREREAAGQLRGSLEEAVKTLVEHGIEADEMRDMLTQTRLRLVLTAHPSEAKRKEVLIKLRHIAEMMEQKERHSLLPRETRVLESNLAEEIEELWQTRPIRARKTEVADEVDFGLYFVTSVVMDVAIDIYDDLQVCLEKYYPEVDWSQPPPVLRYASWIGGDRDGNPNVTTDVTLQTIETLHEAARHVYIQEVAYLRDHLTQDTITSGVSEELRTAVESSPYRTNRYPREIYRQQLDIIWQKLNDADYRSSREFLHDLLLVENSLLQHKGERVANGELQRLIRKVRLFGLHLLPLEVREDAGLHAAALHEIFKHYGITDDYIGLLEKYKQDILTHEISNPRPLFPQDTSHFSPETQRIIATWRMIADAHQRYDPIVIDTVIASMSKQPSDVLAMLLLATEVGIADNVYIVPLFETIQDLRNAPEVMSTLFTNPEYRKYLEKRVGPLGLRQQVMIGYSDSSKDGGYIASNWNLYTAQQTLTDSCLEQGVSLQLFHGRGGSIGRGGGPANRAILSQPPHSLRGGIKITEQGEVIAYRYSNKHIAHRHLNQVLGAVLVAVGINEKLQIPEAWPKAMAELSETSRQVYRKFVYESEGFLDYWQQSTPINELSQLRISSRPAKRKSKGGFSAMRAIPWMFSWMQSRAIIPSWYGAGTAFEAFCQHYDDGLALLQTMYQEWSFFSALIENAQLDVAKADMGIAELYAGLVSDPDLSEAFFGLIREEHARTVEYICAITGQTNLLDNTPAIQMSIERRNPYIDPLNFIQVELLHHLREVDENAPDYTETLNGVLATINGIAAGMKTTG